MFYQTRVLANIAAAVEATPNGNSAGALNVLGSQQHVTANLISTMKATGFTAKMTACRIMLITAAKAVKDWKDTGDPDAHKFASMMLQGGMWGYAKWMGVPPEKSVMMFAYEGEALGLDISDLLASDPVPSAERLFS